MIGKITFGKDNFVVLEDDGAVKSNLDGVKEYVAGEFREYKRTYSVSQGQFAREFLARIASEFKGRLEMPVDDDTDEEGNPIIY